MRFCAHLFITASLGRVFLSVFPNFTTAGSIKFGELLYLSAISLLDLFWVLQHIFLLEDHIFASQLSGAGQGFSFKVATSKLPKIGKMHIHNCFSCSSIFLCFSQWNCSPNSCRFGSFLMHFHYWLGKRKLFWSPAKTDVLFRLWASQSLRFQGEDFLWANFIFLMQLSAPYTPTL